MEPSIPTATTTALPPQLQATTATTCAQGPCGCAPHAGRQHAIPPALGRHPLLHTQLGAVRLVVPGCGIHGVLLAQAGVEAALCGGQLAALAGHHVMLLLLHSCCQSLGPQAA
jgi:hypothetical protein